MKPTLRTGIRLSRLIRAYYANTPLKTPDYWNLSRKHFRVQVASGYYVKLNKFRNRLGPKDLQWLLVKYAPFHVYFSVLDWLFPERVGKKYKAHHAVPIGGEYVFDVDNTNVWMPHNNHVKNMICRPCLANSRDITLHILDHILENYSRVKVVFSGRRGFHIHVLDFDFRDWTQANYENPIKSHEAARFKYSLLLAKRCYGFNRAHFIVSTDPMRVVSLPGSLNASSGLICTFIGSRSDLEKTDIHTLLVNADPYWNLVNRNRISEVVSAHPEFVESEYSLGFETAQERAMRILLRAKKRVGEPVSG